MANTGSSEDSQRKAEEALERIAQTASGWLHEGLGIYAKGPDARKRLELYIRRQHPNNSEKVVARILAGISLIIEYPGFDESHLRRYKELR